MKTLIICESTHHGNTKKLCDAIAAGEKDIIVWESGQGKIPWDEYDLIGFASGIAFSKFYPAITKAVEEIPAGKQVFFLYTCGKNSRDFSEQIAETVKARGCTVLGSYGCRGFDTYGPFKLIGGINKGHPDQAECDGAVKFYRRLVTMLNLSIKELAQEETENTLRLVWRVFQGYEAPDYTKEGVEEFYRSIHDENYLSRLCLYGAFVQGELAGVIATRNAGTHIALFFVDGKYHRQGIGRQLFQAVRAKHPLAKMTVNSSPYAVPIYHKLGFRDTDTEQVVNGLRFTPMERIPP